MRVAFGLVAAAMLLASAAAVANGEHTVPKGLNPHRLERENWETAEFKSYITVSPVDKHSYKSSSSADIKNEDTPVIRFRSRHSSFGPSSNKTGNATAAISAPTALEPKKEELAKDKKEEAPNADAQHHRAKSESAADATAKAKSEITKTLESASEATKAAVPLKGSDSAQDKAAAEKAFKEGVAIGNKIKEKLKRGKAAADKAAADKAFKEGLAIGNTIREHLEKAAKAQAVASKKIQGKSEERKVEDKKAEEKKIGENKSGEKKLVEKSGEHSEKKAKDKSEDKAADKAEDKSEEKSEEKSEDKAEEKTEQKAGDKSEEKAEDKSEEKVEDKSEEKAEDKSEEKAEDKSEEKAEDKSEEKSENSGGATLEDTVEAKTEAVRNFQARFKDLAKAVKEARESSSEKLKSKAKDSLAAAHTTVSNLLASMKQMTGLLTTTLDQISALEGGLSGDQEAAPKQQKDKRQEETKKGEAKKPEPKKTEEKKRDRTARAIDTPIKWTNKVTQSGDNKANDAKAGAGTKDKLDDGHHHSRSRKDDNSTNSSSGSPFATKMTPNGLNGSAINISVDRSKLIDDCRRILVSANLKSGCGCWRMPSCGCRDAGFFQNTAACNGFGYSDFYNSPVGIGGGFYGSMRPTHVSYDLDEPAPVMARSALVSYDDGGVPGGIGLGGMHSMPIMDTGFDNDLPGSSPYAAPSPMGGMSDFGGPDAGFGMPPPMGGPGGYGY